MSWVLMMFEVHRKYMVLAMEEARSASEKDEVPVGAVIVDRNHKILARSHNQTITKCDPTAHAEINLLRLAALKLQNYRLLGTTLYVTVEPCTMCMGAIIHARVSVLVIGSMGTKWGACGSLYNFASDSRFNHSTDIIKGIYAKECRSIMRDFFRNKRKKLK